MSTGALSQRVIERARLCVKVRGEAQLTHTMHWSTVVVFTGPLATHMLRRLKTVELSNQLPRKTDVCVYVPLTDLQSRMYRRFLSGIDVATCLSKVANGGPTGPLWRLNRPGEETFADGKFSPLVVMGCECGQRRITANLD